MYRVRNPPFAVSLCHRASLNAHCSILTTRQPCIISRSSFTNQGRTASAQGPGRSGDESPDDRRRARICLDRGLVVTMTRGRRRQEPDRATGHFWSTKARSPRTSRLAAESRCRRPGRHPGSRRPPRGGDCAHDVRLPVGGEGVSGRHADSGLAVAGAAEQSAGRWTPTLLQEPEHPRLDCAVAAVTTRLTSRHDRGPSGKRSRVKVTRTHACRRRLTPVHRYIAGSTPAVDHGGYDSPAVHHSLDNRSIRPSPVVIGPSCVHPVPTRGRYTSPGQPAWRKNLRDNTATARSPRAGSPHRNFPQVGRENQGSSSTLPRDLRGPAPPPNGNQGAGRRLGGSASSSSQLPSAAELLLYGAVVSQHPTPDARSTRRGGATPPPGPARPQTSPRLYTTTATLTPTNGALRHAWLHSGRPLETVRTHPRLRLVVVTRSCSPSP